MPLKVQFTAEIIAAIDRLRAQRMPWLHVSEKIGIDVNTLRNFRRERPNPAWDGRFQISCMGWSYPPEFDRDVLALSNRETARKHRVSLGVVAGRRFRLRLRLRHNPAQDGAVMNP